MEVTESNANTPASVQEIETIKTELETKHPDFYTFLITIFHTGIRPEEILKIKLEMVNLKKN